MKWTEATGIWPCEKQPCTCEKCVAHERLVEETVTLEAELARKDEVIKRLPNYTEGEHNLEMRALRERDALKAGSLPLSFDTEDFDADSFYIPTGSRWEFRGAHCPQAPFKVMLGVSIKTGDKALLGAQCLLCKKGFQFELVRQPNGDHVATIFEPSQKKEKE